jgi:hypothetical protein
MIQPSMHIFVTNYLFPFSLATEQNFEAARLGQRKRHQSFTTSQNIIAKRWICRRRLVEKHKTISIE